MQNFPEIPKTYLIFALLIGLIILRMWNIDSFTTASLSLLIGYITGKHIEGTREPPVISNVNIKS